MPKIIFERSGSRLSQKEVFAFELKNLARRLRVSLVAEHKFLATRKFSFDWAIPELKIGIEWEGGMFGARGAKACLLCGEVKKVSHFATDRIIRDAEKYNLANINGWAIIRLLPTMVKKNDPTIALNFVQQAIEVKLNGRH